MRFPLLAVVTTLLACGGGRVDPGFYGAPVEEPQASAPQTEGARVSRARFDRPKLVLIRADWCGVCHEVEPGILLGYAGLEAKIDLVVLDVSDARHLARSADVAREEGVAGFFDRFAGRTPTLGIFTQPEQARLVHGPVGDPAHIRRELEAALTRMQDERATDR